MDDVLDNTPDVAVLLSKVEVPQPSGVLVVMGVGLEDTPGLSLRADDSTHFCCGVSVSWGRGKGVTD